MKEKKERTIATLTQGKTRLQLLEITTAEGKNSEVFQDWQEAVYGENQRTCIKYQIRLNRKRIHNSNSEYQMRKYFATYAQNIILQLKIY